MKSFFLSVTFVSITFMVSAQDKDAQTIKAILSAQQNQWNKGNLEGFMKGYWQNDSLLFIGSKGPKYGYQTTLEGYKKGYPDTAHMGKFTSTVVSMQRLSPIYFFIVGKWHLQRSVGNLDGMYTLLFKKIKGEWVIVVDHSS